jgi:Protein of unknown function (DUF3431)
MARRRRRYISLLLGTVAAVYLFLHRTEVTDYWQAQTRQPEAQGPGGSIMRQEMDSLTAKPPPDSTNASNIAIFKPGQPKPSGANYSKMIVVPKMKSEDTDWLYEELSDIPKAIYGIDDRRAKLRPPKNKGNEAMVYLSYIIDFYDDLADINIFIHPHRWTHHNNDIFDSDTAMMLRHLSSERVIREGYMNLRCQWYPGCPAWIRPGTPEPQNDEKKEEILMAQAWAELYPSEALPEVLAQPCCSQFALSRERIRTFSREEYVRLRSWLLKTSLSNSMAGRIFEYIWQYIWTGRSALCPSMHVCYCDGYGACFGSEADFHDWLAERYRLRQGEWDIEAVELQEMKRREHVEEGEFIEARRMEPVDEEELQRLKTRIASRWVVLDEKRDSALEYGRDPRVRAKIAGREWREGDGF